MGAVVGDRRGRHLRPGLRARAGRIGRPGRRRGPRCFGARPSGARSCRRHGRADLAWPRMPSSPLAATIIAAGLVALASGPPSLATFTRVGIICLAPLYVGLPLGAIARSLALFGPAAVTSFIAIIVASDTAQYYTGRLVGIRKLAPLVSPAKTVEGAAGGFAAAAIAGAALARGG